MQLFKRNHMDRYGQDELRKRLRRTQSKSIMGFQKRNVLESQGCEDLPEEEYELGTKESVNNRELKDKKFIFELNKYEKVVEETVFNAVIESLFVKSVPFDDVESNGMSDRLRDMMGETLRSNNVYGMLKQSQARRMRVPFFVERVQRLAVKFAQDAKMDKMLESKQKGPEYVDLTFTIDEEYEKKFEEELNNLPIDNVADYINKKVTNVVREEIERRKEEKEEMDDIEDIANESSSDDGDDDGDTSELDQAIKEDNMDDDDDDDIMNIDPVVENGDDDDDDAGDESYVDEATGYIKKKRKKRRNLSRKTLARQFDNIHGKKKSSGVDNTPFTEILHQLFQEEIHKNNQSEIQPNSGDDLDRSHTTTDVDRELIFANGIANYSVMETLHTLNLMEYTPDMFRRKG